MVHHGSLRSGPGRARGRRTAALLARLLLAAALSAGCGPGQKDTPPRASRRPNIIFLTVDTLRPDHLALYGYSRDTMPFVESFAESSVVFDNAVVPRGITRPSYASMLTGLYPYRHGVRSNDIQLHEDVATLPEALRDAGYHTAAFVSNFYLLGDFSGLQQGFDLYDDSLEEYQADKPYFERPAGETLEAILSWLDGDPPEPFFLFTNFIDPHGPYNPPAEHRVFHSGQTKRLEPDQIQPYQLLGHSTKSYNFYDYVDRYDGEIRYTDAALGELMAELGRRYDLGDAMVIFTADHGESFGEHGAYFRHYWHLWEETVRVPLVIHVPGGAPRRIADVCSPMDLTPTVLDWIGANPDSPMDGRSLLPLLRGETAPERPLLVEFLPQGQSFPSIYAIRTTTYKLIRAVRSGSGALMDQGVFNIREDPLEAHRAPFDPKSPLHRELSDGLDGMLAGVESYVLPFTVTEFLPPDSSDASVLPWDQKKVVKRLSKQQMEKLRSLGYVR